MAHFLLAWYNWLNLKPSTVMLKHFARAIPPPPPPPSFQHDKYGLCCYNKQLKSTVVVVNLVM